MTNQTGDRSIMLHPTTRLLGSLLLIACDGLLIACGGASATSTPASQPVEPTKPTQATDSTLGQKREVVCYALVGRDDGCTEAYVRAYEGPYQAAKSFPTDDEVYGWIHLCRDDEGAIVAAKYASTTPSDDWNLDGFYCFRGGGTLMFFEETYNTQYGQVSVHARQEFEANGQSSRTTHEVRDWNTGQISNAGYGRFFNTPIYPTLESLLAALGLTPEEVPPKPRQPAGNPSGLSRKLVQ